MTFKIVISLTTLLISAVLIATCAVTNTHYSQTSSDPNFKQGIYINNHIEHPNKSFFSFLRLRLFGDEKWANHEKAAALIPQKKLELHKVTYPQATQVTWLGHSTFLIQHQGLNILTDPIFSKRASPVSFAGPKRYTPVAMPIENLPTIDIVIISHNHYDHLDAWSIKQLGNKPKYLIPSGLAPWFKRKGIDAEQLIERRWWQSASESQWTITAMPSQHWSARGLNDRHKTHWASWFVELEGFNLWFAGDTGYNAKDFKVIGDYVADRGFELDLALIPIGAYAPRDFMQTYHVNVEEAVKIHHDVQSQLSIGMHWGTFPLTAEWPMEPFEWLNQLRNSEKINSDTQFITLKIGETHTL